MFKKFFALLLFVACLTNTTFASDWYVDTNTDVDLDTCVAGEVDNDDDCSFRDAVSQVVVGDNIYFLEDLYGASTITMGTPVSVGTNNVTIDATVGSRTVHLNDTGSATNGIVVAGDGITVKGLYLTGFLGAGIVVSGDSDVIDSNILGLDPTESVVGMAAGVEVSGTNTSIVDNTISGNTIGVSLVPSAADISITGNNIGTDISGGQSDATDRGNGRGIMVDTGGNLTGAAVEGLVVGGLLVTESNIISDNTTGIYFSNANGDISGNVNIQNNYFGFKSDGTSALGNSEEGIRVQGSDTTFADAVDFTIEDNVIGNNGAQGIEIYSGNTIVVDGNKVGVDSTGIVSAANGSTGVFVDADTSVTIIDNVVSNSAGGANGVFITGAPTITVTGNKIGVDSTGANDMGNGASGLRIEAADATSIVIGGLSTLQNIFGNNTVDGLYIGDVAATAVISIYNNLIGVEGDGATAAGNGVDGVYVGDGQTVTIGGDHSTLGNIISNNFGGISFVGGESVTIQGNYIGTTSTGLTAAGNTSKGIYANSAVTTALTIGGATAGLGNVISANDIGINVVGLATASTPVSILGNIIGLGADETTSTSMGNSIGIEANSGAITVGGNNRLGVDGTGELFAGNVISNSSTGSGILLGNGVSTFEGYGNIIGLKRGAVSGVYDTAAGNGDQGIKVSSNTITSFILGAVFTGSEWSQRNIISGSNGTAAGILFDGASALTSAIVKNNYIGTDYLGTGAVPNTYGLSALTSVNTTFNIGGTGAYEGNLISGNSSSAIFSNTGLVWNILGNYIGTNAAGTAALANEGGGISVYGGTATYNIGSTVDSGKNIVSGNTNGGITVYGTTPAAFEVKGNYIGTDVTGEVAIGNGSGVESGLFNYGGLELSLGGSGAIIGTDLDGTNDDIEGNVISGNYGHGILAYQSDGLIIAGNKIGLSASGLPLGNVNGVGGSVEEVNGAGIAIVDLNGGGTGTVNATKIGTNSVVASVIDNARNYISANEGSGIAVYHLVGSGLDGLGQDWDNGYIRNNYIGVGTTGAASDLYKNADYEIFVDSNQSNLITNFSIDGSNRINNDLHLAVYILDVAQSYISNLSTMAGDNLWTDTVCPISYRYLEVWTTGGTAADYYRPLSLACPVNSGSQGAPGLSSVSAGGSSNNSVVDETPEVVAEEGLEDQMTEDSNENVVEDGNDNIIVEPILETPEVAEEVEVVNDVVIQEELEILAGATATVGKYVQEVAFDNQIPNLTDTQLQTIQEYIDSSEQETDVVEKSEIEKALSEGLGSLSEQEIEVLTTVLEGSIVNDLEGLIASEGVILPRNGKSPLYLNSLDDLALHMDEIVDGIMYGGADYDQNGIADLIQLQYGESGALFVNNKDGDQFGDADEIAFGLDITKYDEFPDMKLTIVGFEENGILKTSDRPLIKGLSKSDGSVYDVNLDSETGEVEIKEVLGDFKIDEEGKWTLEPEDGLELGKHYLVGINDEGFVDLIEIEVVAEELVVSEVILEEDSTLTKSGKVLTGHTEPGSIVYVSWKSVIFSSVVISDASEGSFTAVLPEGLPEGEHEALVFAYDPSIGLVGNIANLIFNR